jgi:hypothetical protein
MFGLASIPIVRHLFAHKASTVRNAGAPRKGKRKPNSTLTRL